MKRGRHLTPIGSLVDSCLDRAAGQPGAGRIWRVWNDAVGAQIAPRAQPVRLRDRTLVVAVTSAPWMQELHMLKRSLVDALNARLPHPLVDDVYLVLTEARRDPAGPPRARPAPKCAPPPPESAIPTNLREPLRQSFQDVLAAWRRRAGRD